MAQTYSPETRYELTEQGEAYLDALASTCTSCGDPVPADRALCARCTHVLLRYYRAQDDARAPLAS